MAQTSFHTGPLVEQMTGWRRAFHRHPELEFDLPHTSARVADLLESFGLEVHRGLGQTGVVGVLQRGNGTRSIGLRADMDALPIQEANDFDHRSEVPGKMHACGHDGHMAMLLGAARHLAEAGRFSGRVVFVFQPNEEFGLGAASMIRDGLFTRFPVDQVYGMHNIPGMPLGHFATRAGPITASEALFEIVIAARGGACRPAAYGGGCNHGGGRGGQRLANHSRAQAGSRTERRCLGDRIPDRWQEECLARINGIEGRLPGTDTGHEHGN